MRGWGRERAPGREGLGSEGDTGEAGCGLGLGVGLSFSGRSFHPEGVLREGPASRAGRLCRLELERGGSP